MNCRRPNPWIDCIKNFTIFLQNNRVKIEHHVKIAIIDNGVNTSLNTLDGKIANGKSFCPYLNSTDFMTAYFAPSGKHETQMATLISQICPHVRLYVARLEEHPRIDGDGRRQITTKSAAEVRDVRTSLLYL